MPSKSAWSGAFLAPVLAALLDKEDEVVVPLIKKLGIKAD